MCRKIEENLIKSNIKYKIFGGINFYQRKEVKDLISYLRLTAGYRDTYALRRILNVPKRGLGSAAEKKIVDFIRANEEKDCTLISLMDMLGEKDKKINVFSKLYKKLRYEFLKEYKLTVKILL